MRYFFLNMYTKGKEFFFSFFFTNDEVLMKALIFALGTNQSLYCDLNELRVNHYCFDVVVFLFVLCFVFLDYSLWYDSIKIQLYLIMTVFEYRHLVPCIIVDYYKKFYWYYLNCKMNNHLEKDLVL
ncbi:hypothetical protein BD770DRAFT_378338 [Pilaira anomala]|nr:hypothetical protein BD770DRAFT_378338 [Pilaira anomala]